MMRTQVSKDLLTEQKGGILSLTLNRPEVLNALTAGMLEDLLREMERSEKDVSVRCVVLRASGRAFCAGADLALLRDLHASGEPLELGEELRRRFNPLIRLMRSMDKPVLAAVNGVAAGAGAGLALAPDIKIASENASFISVFIRVGLAPDSGMSHVLARGLGRSLALEHAWTAKPISAAQAAHFGLVNRVVPGERLEAEVDALAHELCRAPAEAVALTKRAIHQAADDSFGRQLDFEALMQDALGKTPDHREGVAAFLEKRSPKFSGG